jgi:hypothetical protein
MSSTLPGLVKVDAICIDCKQPKKVARFVLKSTNTTPETYVCLQCRADRIDRGEEPEVPISLGKLGYLSIARPTGGAK